MVLALVFACMNLSILTFFFCLYDPRDGIFLGQLIPLEFYNSIFPSGFLVAIYHAFLVFVLETTICLTGGLILIYMFYLTVLLDKELHLNSTKKYRTSNLFREPNHLGNNYRTMQILNEHFLHLIGPYVIGFHYLFSVFPVFANVIVMRYWNALSWIVLTLLIFSIIVVCLFWILILQFGKYLWIKGKQNLESWKFDDGLCSQREKRIMEKFRRSCRIILIRHGNTLLISKTTQLVYIKNIILYTGKSWLTFK